MKLGQSSTEKPLWKWQINVLTRSFTVVLVLCGIWLLGAWVTVEKGKANWLHLSRMGSVLLFGG